MQDKVLTLRKGKLGRLRPGHPWIYKGQFTRPAHFIQPGDIVSVKDSDGRFIGRGYYNQKSEITARLLTFNDEGIDGEFFRKRFEEALAKRRPLQAVTNAYRAIFSEADGIPGLIVDLYNDTAVFQALTLGIDKLKGLVVEAIRGVLKPEYIYEKSVSPFRKLEGLKEVRMWSDAKGETGEGKGVVEIFEGKVRFLVDVEHCHKTGFYLDQRRSRMALANIAKGKRVLDLFCYTGGFAVSAAVYGAVRVLGADIKKDWIDIAAENAGLNGVAEKTEFVKGDSFEVLKEINDSGDKFDIIIVDPPSFLKTKGSLITAAKGYKQLNLLAMKALSDDGILATFSCSHNMPNELFSKTLKDAASEAGKKLTILKRCHQAEDHPINRKIPETEYLKGYFLRVAD